MTDYLDDDSFAEGAKVVSTPVAKRPKVEEDDDSFAEGAKVVSSPAAAASDDSFAEGAKVVSAPKGPVAARPRVPLYAGKPEGYEPTKAGVSLKPDVSWVKPPIFGGADPKEALPIKRADEIRAGMAGPSAGTQLVSAIRAQKPPAAPGPEGSIMRAPEIREHLRRQAGPAAEVEASQAARYAPASAPPALPGMATSRSLSDPLAQAAGTAGGALQDASDWYKSAEEQASSAVQTEPTGAAARLFSKPLEARRQASEDFGKGLSTLTGEAAKAVAPDSPGVQGAVEGVTELVKGAADFATDPLFLGGMKAIGAAGEAAPYLYKAVTGAFGAMGGVSAIEGAAGLATAKTDEEKREAGKKLAVGLGLAAPILGGTALEHFFGAAGESMHARDVAKATNVRAAATPELARRSELLQNLGLGEDATDAQIASAVKKTIRETHPDVPGNVWDPLAQQRFNRALEARDQMPEAGEAVAPVPVPGKNVPQRIVEAGRALSNAVKLKDWPGAADALRILREPGAEAAPVIGEASAQPLPQRPVPPGMRLGAPDDRVERQGVPSEVGVGQEPVEAGPVEGRGGKAPETGGVVQGAQAGNAPEPGGHVPQEAGRPAPAGLTPEQEKVQGEAPADMAAQVNALTAGARKAILWHKNGVQPTHTPPAGINQIVTPVGTIWYRRDTGLKRSEVVEASKTVEGLGKLLEMPPGGRPAGENPKAVTVTDVEGNEVWSAEVDEKTRDAAIAKANKMAGKIGGSVTETDRKSVVAGRQERAATQEDDFAEGAKVVSTPETAAPDKDLIEKIVAAARRPDLEIRPKIELKGTDGKWYRGDLPSGVQYGGEKRTYGYGYVTPDGVGVGNIHPTEEAARAAQTENRDRDAAAHRAALEGMSPERLAEQAKFWLEDKGKAKPAPVPAKPAKKAKAKKPPLAVDMNRQKVANHLKVTIGNGWEEELVGLDRAAQDFEAKEGRSKAEFWKELANDTIGAAPAPEPIHKPVEAPKVETGDLGKVVTGPDDVAITAEGEEIPYTWAFVNVHKLIPSHDSAGNPNPGYARAGETIQNRDRASEDSVAQMSSIKSNPDPRRLAYAPSATDGAPIIRPDGRALTNGRTAGLQAAFKEGNAARYRAGIAAEARRTGMSEEAIAEGMKDPESVLVRLAKAEYINKTDQTRLARDTNVGVGLRMSITEQGRSDAAVMMSPGSVDETTRVLALIPEDGNGDIRSSAYLPFAQAFAKAFVPANERAGLFDKGSLTNEGALRVQAALVAAAYGDSKVVDRFLTSDAGAGNPLRKAVLAVAPDFATVNMQQQHGELEAFDVTPPLVDAAEFIVDMQASGKTLEQTLRPTGKTGSGKKLQAPELIKATDRLSPEGLDIINILDQNARTPAKASKLLVGIFRELAKVAQQLKISKDQGGLFGEGEIEKVPVPKIGEAWKIAKENYEEQQRGKGLFGDEDAEPSGAEAEGAGTATLEGAGEGGTAPDKGKTPPPDDQLRETDAEYGTPAIAAPTFFSAVERAIDAMPFKSMPAVDLAARLTKTPGVKQEELEWVGLVQWLQEMSGQDMKGRVSKDEVKAFLEENRVEVKTVEIGGKPRPIVSGTPRTKYDTYTLPGGKNYREVLLQKIDPRIAKLEARREEAKRRMDEIAALPAHGRPPGTDAEWDKAWWEDWRVGKLLSGMSEEAVAIMEQRDKIYDQMNAIELRQGQINPKPTPEYERLDAEFKRLDEELAEANAQKKKVPEPYSSGHFDTPNVLVHYRAKDRIDARGKKVYFLEEVQSDWHQQGRERGYDTGPIEFTLYEVVAKKHMDNPGRPSYATFDTREQAEKYIGEYSPETQNALAIVENRQTRQPQGVVPNAPFKKTWPLLAFKHALRYAAENGYDSIAWTPGEVQASRYDLSKQIDKLEYEKTGENTYTLAAYKNGHDVLNEDGISIQRIEDLVGKELARKIAAGEGELSYPNAAAAYPGFSGARTIPNLMLKVGGEGMKGFYDKILPAEIGKYIKAWGGKVGETKLRTGDPDQAGIEQDHPPSVSATAHSIDVTPAMREAALAGQALFEKKTKYDPRQRGLFDDGDTGSLRKPGEEGKGAAAGRADEGVLPAAPAGGADRGGLGLSSKSSRFTLGQLAARRAEAEKRGRAQVEKLVSRLRASVPGGVDPDNDPLVIEATKIAKTFRSGGFVSLIGHDVPDIKALGVVAQVAANPAYETLRVALLDDDNVLVQEIALSAHLSAGVSAHLAVETGAIETEMKLYGATKWALIHNHPGGDATPSPPDIAFTTKRAGQIPGFMGHVVIDHDSFATIDATGKVTMHDLDETAKARRPKIFEDPDATANAKHLGVVCNGPEDVAKLAIDLHTKERSVTLLYVNRIGKAGVNKIRAIGTVPFEKFLDFAWATRRLRLEQGFHGAQHILAYSSGKGLSLAEKIQLVSVAQDLAGVNIEGGATLSDFLLGEDPRMSLNAQGITREPSLGVSNATNTERLAETETDYGDEKSARKRAFDRWFEGSVVTNDDGSPKVMYHGTGAGVEFDVFSTAGVDDPDIGAHFGTAGQANERLDFQDRLPKKRLVPVYLSIKNPFRLPDLGDFSNPMDWEHNLSAGGSETERRLVHLARQYIAQWNDEPGDRKAWQADFVDDAKKLLSDAGYDGLVYVNEAEAKSEEADSYVAFHPWQIKSAIANKGTFSPEDPSILNEEGPGYGKKGKFVPSPEREKNLERWAGKTVVRDKDGSLKRVYHGTVGEFDTFSPGKANVEGDLGAGFYFTSNPDDASVNYGNDKGADLESKVEHLAERIEQEIDPDDGLTLGMEKAREVARERLGVRHGGAVLPVYLKIENPLVLGGPGEPSWDSQYDEENDSDKGELTDLFEAMRVVRNGIEADGGSVGRDEYDRNLSKLYDYAGDKASKLLAIVKDAFVYAEDENGDLISGEAVRRVVEKMGYDGIVDHTVDVKFGTRSPAARFGKAMHGVTGDTVHYIVFKPNQIKSAIGNRGTFSKRNPSLVAEEPPAYGKEKPSALDYASRFAPGASRALRPRGPEDEVRLAATDPTAGIFSAIFANRAPKASKTSELPSPTDSFSPEVERRMRAAEGIVAPTILDRVKKAATDLEHNFTRHFIELDTEESPTLALDADILRQLESSPDFAKQVALDSLQYIADGLDRPAARLFTRILALRDLQRSIQEGLYAEKDELPFGYEELGDVSYDLRRYEAMAEKDEAVAGALAKREKFADELTQKLVDMELLSEDVLEDDRYYHRQVMAIFNQKEAAYVGTGSRDVRLHKKGFQKARSGGGDFNLRYQEAEFEWMAQAHGLIAMREALDRLKEANDIKPGLEQRAKWQNTLAIYGGIENYNEVQRIKGEIAAIYAAGDLVLDSEDRKLVAGLNAKLDELDPLRPFGQRIGWNIHDLKKKAEHGELDHVDKQFQEAVDQLAMSSEWEEFRGEEDTPDLFFPLLNHLLEKGKGGSIEAAGIYKAIADRKKFIKTELGKDFTTWRDLIPETHPMAPKSRAVVWQPEKGSMFYRAQTLPERALERFVEDLKEAPEDVVDREALEKLLGKAREALVMGGPKPEWVIPEGLAKTLDNWKGSGRERGVEDIYAKLLQAWKQWVLLNPTRALPYSLNNQSGDLDVVIAAFPGALRGWGQAARDLWGYTVKEDKSDQKLVAEIQRAMKLGVVSSGQSVQEIPDINEAWAFKALTSDDPNVVQKTLQTYWSGTKKFSTWRENTLRLALFRYLENEMKTGKKLYGASKPHEVDAVKDVSDRAAKVSRELIGDYGNISVAGQFLRHRLMPFYSWIEINSPRYVRLLKNAAREGGGGGAGGAGGGGGTGRAARVAGIGAKKIAVNYAKLALLAPLLYGAVQAWNNIMFPEEEKLLSGARGGRMYLILGRAPDGSIITMRFQGALSDALDWFGAGNVVADARDVASGKRTVRNKFNDALTSPLNKIANAWEPFSKTFFELVFGYRSYPSLFKEGSLEMAPSKIRNRVEYAGDVAWPVGALYRKVTGKPKRPAPDLGIPGVGGILSALTQRVDPGEAAYWYARNAAGKWLEDQGVSRSTGGPTGEAKDRADALYYFKKACEWSDDSAASKWLVEYYKLGGTPQKMNESFVREHPLGGLPLGKRGAFLNTLSDKDKTIVQDAVGWYEKGRERGRGVASETPFTPAPKRAATP